MKKSHRVMIVSIVTLFLFAIVCIPAYAINPSETYINDEGWVQYRRLNLVQLSYKINPSDATGNATYIVKQVQNLGLPYGPVYNLVDENQIITDFWMTVGLNSVDVDGSGMSSIAVLKPGEAISLKAGVKIFIAGRPDNTAFAPIDASMYGARIYLDDDYNRYLTPSIEATTNNGAYIYWSFTNTTNQDIILSRVTMGLFEDDYTYDSYGYGYIIRSMSYKILSDTQASTQAIKDSIDSMGEQLNTAINQMGEDISDSIAAGTDQIINGWDGGSTPPDGGDSIAATDDIESSLVDSSVVGFDHVRSWYDDSSSFISDFGDSLNMVSAMFDSLQFSADWWVLLIISLSLGMFSFLVGIVHSISGRRK